MLKFHHSAVLHPHELNRRSRTFAAILLNDFGFSMIGVLIPVFLWQEGFNLTEIALFHIAMFSMRPIFSALAVRLAWRVGSIRALQVGFVSALLAIGSMVAVTTSPSNSYILLSIAAIANGASAGLYWVSRHLNIEAITDFDNAGSTATWIRLFETIVITLGPLAGGFIAALFGSEYALGTSFLFIFLSLLYVVSSKDDDNDFSIHSKDIVMKDIKYDVAGNAARGFDMGVALAAWPLYIFLVTDRIEQVGAISAISGLIMIPLMVWTARNVDNNEGKLLSFGVVLRTLAYPFRALASNFTQILAVNIAADIGDVPTGGAEMSHYYKQADRLSRLRYTYFMEIFFPVGSILAWIVIFALSISFDTKLSLQLIFLISVAFVPFTLLLIRSINATKKETVLENT